MKKSTIKWISKMVDIKLIDKTPGNYKLRTALGAERLKKSLEMFGLAGNVVVNPSKGGRYVLIDGNSRIEEERKKGTTKIWCSVPDKPLTPQQFKEMSAMFDFAKAGEVDLDRINSELGTTKAFFDEWNMIVPKAFLDKAGKKAVVDMERKKESDKAKAVKLKDKNLGAKFEIVQLMLNAKEYEEYVQLIERSGCKSPVEAVLKALRKLVKK